MAFDGIILDVDGTLWNTTEIVAQAWNKAISRICPAIPLVTPKQLQSQFGKIMEVIADNLFVPATPEEKKLLLAECCKEEQKALEKLDKDISYPHVRETVKTLSKTHKVFIVSNCQKGYIELTMEKNHLKEYITDWECYGNTGMGKDKNIALVIERNNLKSPLYVGDTQGDYEACLTAQVPFVWAAYGFGTPTGYYAKIEDFARLLSLV